MTPASGAGERTCYCHRCERTLHPRGVGRHRAMHRDRHEDVTIDLDNGTHHYTYNRRQTTIWDFLPTPGHHATQQRTRQDTRPAGPDPSNNKN